MNKIDTARRYTMFFCGLGFFSSAAFLPRRFHISLGSTAFESVVPAFWIKPELDDLLEGHRGSFAKASSQTCLGSCSCW